MRQALEEMYPIVEEVELDEAKYELYHKDFSSAMQHAYHVAKKHHGITIDPKEIDDKVATGPSKPSEGKTNKYRLKGDKGAVQIQVYNKGGSKPFELNMYKEEVDLDEGTKQVLAHGGKGQYKAVRDGDITKIMYKGKVVGTADFDSGADSFFASIKGEKGQKSFDDAQAMVDYFAKKKITEEVDLDEGGMKDLLIRAQELMDPSKNRKEGIQMVAKGLKVSEKEATKLVDAVIKMNEESDLDEGFINIGGAKVKDDEKSILQHIKKTFPNVKKVRKDPQHGWIPVFEELAKIKGKTPGDEGRRSAVEDDIERAEKKGDKKEVEKLKEADLDEGKMKKGDTVTVLIGPHKGDKHEIIHDFGDGTYNVKPIRVPKIKYRLGAVKAKASDLKKEEADLDEKKKSTAQASLKDVMALDKKNVSDKKQAKKDKKRDDANRKSNRAAGMEEVDLDEVEEGAAADARRAMKKDKDFSRRDSADDDNTATDDDVKAASKNIMMQMRKAVSMKGNFPVEFGDKKKVKIPVKIAQVVQQKYNSMKKPADKEKFQVQIAKSYKDMLRVLKAGYGEQKESILDRIDKKLKERKNG